MDSKKNEDCLCKSNGFLGQVASALGYVSRNKGIVTLIKH